MDFAWVAKLLPGKESREGRVSFQREKLSRGDESKKIRMKLVVFESCFKPSSTKRQNQLPRQ